MPPPDHSVRIRDGEREIEVSGNPAFVRQVLDDLPALMARLRGEPTGRTTISMPAPPEAQPPRPEVATVAPAPDEPAGPGASVAAQVNGRRGRGKGRTPETALATSLEDRIFDVLRTTDRPLAVAAIRQRIDGADVTGQQVRRLLERAGTRVVMSTDRPATYSLR